MEVHPECDAPPEEDAGSVLYAGDIKREAEVDETELESGLRDVLEVRRQCIATRVRASRSCTNDVTEAGLLTSDLVFAIEVGGPPQNLRITPTRALV
jgi:hypothetical protein